VPDEYKNQVGSVSAATTGPQLHRFVEDGGTLLAIGGSTGFDHYFGLPLSNALIDTSADGEGGRLPRRSSIFPGSVLQASVDNTLPIAYGLPDKVDVFYMNNPASICCPEPPKRVRAPSRGLPPPNRCERLGLGPALPERDCGAVEGDVGKGKVYLFGPEITFRAQPYGTFKFLFNAIYLAGATKVTL